MFILHLNVCICLCVRTSVHAGDCTMLSTPSTTELHPNHNTWISVPPCSGCHSGRHRVISQIPEKETKGDFWNFKLHRGFQKFSSTTNLQPTSLTLVFLFANQSFLCLS